MGKLSRISMFTLWGVIAVSVVLFVSLLANISKGDNSPILSSWINTNLSWAYILLGVTAALTILFSIYQMATDFRAAKQGLLGVGFIILLFFIAYLMASDEIPQFLGADKFVADGTLTSSSAKWIETGLYGTYLSFGIAVVSLIYSSVSRLFK